MSGPMTRSAFEELCADNIRWLEQQPRTLERDHIILIVKMAPEKWYGPAPRDEERTCLDFNCPLPLFHTGPCRE